MKPGKTVKSLLTAIAMAGALGAGAISLGGSKTASEGPAKPPMPPPLPVDVAVMKSEPVRLWTNFSARLRAVDAVDLRPQVSGTIVEIGFKDGARVRQGDVLFVIDPRPYRAAVKEAKAELAAAREQHAHAAKELQRARALVDSSAISERVLDDRANATAVSRSEVGAAEARLARAEIDLDHAFVKAPISGRVSRAEITVGNLVQAGPEAPVLTSIVADDRIYADFEVDERTYLRFVHGRARNLEAERRIPVRLQVGENSDIELEGHIHSFDNRIDPATGTIRARALFPNTAGTLLPGMFAHVKLGAPADRTAVTLTEGAVLTDQDRKFVYVVDAHGRAAYRQVTLGAKIGDKRVISSGLAAGDRVITSHLLAVRPHIPVAPRPVAPRNERADAAAGKVAATAAASR